MTAEALLGRLRARGVEFKLEGNALLYRPVEALEPDDLEAIQRLKPEVLRLLHADHALWVPQPDSATVREVLGPDPDLHDLAILRFDVLAAVVALEREIQAGAVEPRLRLVRGRPLADWLSLEQVAHILRGTR